MNAVWSAGQTETYAAPAPSDGSFVMSMKLTAAALHGNISDLDNGRTELSDATSSRRSGGKLIAPLWSKLVIYFRT